MQIVSLRRSNRSPRPRRKTSQRRGAAVVELAIFIVPVLLIIFGTINTCQYLHLRQDALIVAFEGARMRSIRNFTTEDSSQICDQFLRDRGVVNGRTDFVFPQGEQSGAHFEVRVTVPGAQLDLPFNLYDGKIVVSRHATID